MKIYLAPMEGITTYIYRNAYQKYYGGIDTYYTPFVANRKLKSRELRDVLPENNHAHPLIPQILTNKADVFLEIAQQLQDMGYSEVNFNLGCPSGTVVAKHRGAGFLDDPVELEKFLDIIYNKCPLPISIKTRLGIESLYEWEDLLKIYAKFPIRELIIHARTLHQQYSGEPNIAGFQMAQQALSCPLCYNGDIYDIESYEHFVNECPSAEAVMIGRGAIANPGLPRTLLASTKESDECFLDFHNELIAGYQDYMSGELPVLYKMKELWTFWSQHLHPDKKVLKKIQKAQNIQEYKSYVAILFQNPGQSHNI